MSWLGIDIGGANLKVADGNGFAHSMAFPLWRHPQQLSAALTELLDQSPSAASLAVSMTGELADCFATKAEGVAAICTAAEEAAKGRDLNIYLCDGRWADTKAARAEVMLASASNWHVLASFASRYLIGEMGLLIDIGSTTCDLIPLDRSGPCSCGENDPDRLMRGELVYTGIQRSPVCAVVSRLPWGDRQCPVAQELFATTQDAYLLLEELAEEPENFNTADGRPSTKANAHTRLARSLCADDTLFSREDAKRAAVAIHDAQRENLISSANLVIERMNSLPTTVVVSGHGEFLARTVVPRLGLPCDIISLAAKLGPRVSRSACAHALAVLAREREEP